MSDGMGREFAYLSSHATNRYFIPNWGTLFAKLNIFFDARNPLSAHECISGTKPCISGKI